MCPHPLPEVPAEAPSSKLGRLKTFIREGLTPDLESGPNKVGYSRQHLSANPTDPDSFGYGFKVEGDTVTIQALPLNEVAKKGAGIYRETGGFRGSCREVAPTVAQVLTEDGVLDTAEVWACAQPKDFPEKTGQNEYHYATLGTIEDKEYIIDLGYNQPMPIPVEVDGGPVYSEFYREPNAAEGDFPHTYGGRVRYEAKRVGQGSDQKIILTIGTDEDPKQYKYFEFRPAQQVDAEIVATFGKVTGKNYGTAIVETGEGKHAVRKVVPESGEKSGTLFELNTALEKARTRTVEYLSRD